MRKMRGSLIKVAQKNRAIGRHWFDADTMDFFTTRIESGLILGSYFITSEQYDDDAPRLFTVRHAEESGEINTVGEFQGYKSAYLAEKAIRELQGAEI